MGIPENKTVLTIEKITNITMKRSYASFVYRSHPSFVPFPVVDLTMEEDSVGEMSPYVPDGLFPAELWAIIMYYCSFPAMDNLSCTNWHFHKVIRQDHLPYNRCRSLFIKYILEFVENVTDNLFITDRLDEDQPFTYYEPQWNTLISESVIRVPNMMAMTTTARVTPPPVDRRTFLTVYRFRNGGFTFCIRMALEHLCDLDLMHRPIYKFFNDEYTIRDVVSVIAHGLLHTYCVHTLNKILAHPFATVKPPGFVKSFWESLVPREHIFAEYLEKLTDLEY